jgi:hypothetical protein
LNKYIEKCEVGVTSNGISFAQNFAKTGKLVQKLKGWTHTYIQHCDIIKKEGKKDLCGNKGSSGKKLFNV